MSYLPQFNKLIVSLAIASSVFVFSSQSVLASSAYINPSQGKITSKNFLVSVYVESSVSEPEMASTELKITYPASVNVVSIAQGEFDSYLEKSFDATTKTITIKAVNNAGNYKKGKVKVAGINFEAVANTGTAQLKIDSTSKISGAGGEELLTETIDSNYTLAIEATDPTATATPSVTDTTSSTTDTTGKAPETGVNNIMFYSILSSILLAGGVYLARTSIKVKR